MKTLIGYGFAALAGAFLMQPAHAQDTGLVPLRLKIGAYAPKDGGTPLDAEADVRLPVPGLGNTFVTAGYSQGSKNGRRLRVIPLTITRLFAPINPAKGITGNPYFGLGAGAYLLRASGGGNSESNTTIGGFALAGYQFPNPYFVEAKYHVAGKVGGLSPNGFALMLGRRF